MPELPEVETVLRTLETRLEHPTITQCRVLWNNIIATPDVPSFCKTIQGLSIHDYQRIGKYLIFDLGTYHWVCHLRMEGKFYIQDAQDSYDKHTHVFFDLSNGKQLRYHDTRKFGKMYLYKKQEDISTYPCFANVGYDVFDERVTPLYLYQKVHKKKAVLKQVLLDQSVMAGIGNIYADEICFALGMHPETRISRLRKRDFEDVLFHTRRILTGAMQAGGTTIRSYTSSLGVDGRFQLRLKVHAKKGEMCSVCQSEIKKIVVVTRGTCYCPTCQKKR